MASSDSESAPAPTPQGVELHGLLLRLMPQWREALPGDVQLRRRIDGRGHYVAASPANCEAFCAAVFAAPLQASNLGRQLELSLIPVTITAADPPRLLRPGNWLRLHLRWAQTGADESIAFDVPGNQLGAAVDAWLPAMQAIASFYRLPHQTAQSFHMPVHWIDPERAISAPPGGYGRVLFVDDEPMVLDVHRQSMESLGYEVVTAQSGREALRLFLAAPLAFDLVLSDQAMPEMDGNELARRIREQDGEIPILLCTGLATPSGAALAERAGVTAVLEKPFSLEELAHSLRSALAQARRRGP